MAEPVVYTPRQYVREAYTPDTRTLGALLLRGGQDRSAAEAIRGATAAQMWENLARGFQQYQNATRQEAEQAATFTLREREREENAALKREEMAARTAERDEANRVRQEGVDRETAIYTAENTAPGPVNRFEAEILQKFPGTAARVRSQQTLPATAVPGALGEISQEPESFSVLQPTPQQTRQAQIDASTRQSSAQIAADRSADNERQAARDAEAARHGRVMEANTAATNARLSAPKPPSDARIDRIGSNFKTESVVKKAQTMAEAVDFVKGLNPDTKNPSDDQALIYAFAKAMDPDSVVREGEYATVQKYSQSLAEKYGFDAKRVFTNTVFLTPDARKNMKATIESRFEPVRKQYNNLRKSYVDRVNKVTGGADGEDYINDYGAAFPESSAKADPVDALIKKYGGG